MDKGETPAVGGLVLWVPKRRGSEYGLVPRPGGSPGLTLLRVAPPVSVCLTQEAAVREAMEEAGVRIVLTGVLAVEYTADGTGGARMRVIFSAEPENEDACFPKTLPDYESAGAAWVALEDISNLHLRGGEPVKWCPLVARGELGAPMSLFTKEH